MITSADQDLADGCLVLEVAFEAESGIALGEELFVHGTVRLVADEAAFARGFVLVNERPPLLRVAAVTGFVVAHERSAAGDDRMALVRVMAIAAGHFAFDDGVGVRQIELAALVEVAVETGLGRFVRIDDGIACAAGLVVDTAGAMTGFTPHVHGVPARDLQFRVSRRRKIAADVFVAFGAALRPDKFRARNVRGCDDSAGNRRAGNENHSDKENADQGGEPPVAAKP